MSENEKQSPVPVREYVYEALPAEPKAERCEVCDSAKLGQLWIHARITIRMPLYAAETAAPLLCSRCNQELREHIRKFLEGLPAPFHGRKQEHKQVAGGAYSAEQTIGEQIAAVLEKVSGRIE